MQMTISRHRIDTAGRDSILIELAHKRFLIKPAPRIRASDPLASVFKDPENNTSNSLHLIHEVHVIRLATKRSVEIVSIQLITIWRVAMCIRIQVYYPDLNIAAIAFNAEVAGAGFNIDAVSSSSRSLSALLFGFFNTWKRSTMLSETHARVFRCPKCTRTAAETV